MMNNERYLDVSENDVVILRWHDGPQRRHEFLSNKHAEINSFNTKLYTLIIHGPDLRAPRLVMFSSDDLAVSSSLYPDIPSCGNVCLQPQGLMCRDSCIKSSNGDVRLIAIQENTNLSHSGWYWNIATRLLGCLHSSWPWKRDATVSEDYALMNEIGGPPPISNDDELNLYLCWLASGTVSG